MTVGFESQSLDVDKYPEAPSTLSLQQVHVFVRHGAFLNLLTFVYQLLSIQVKEPQSVFDLLDLRRIYQSIG